MGTGKSDPKRAQRSAVMKVGSFKAAARALQRGDPSGKAYIATSGYAQKYVACVGPATRGAVRHAGNVQWPNEAEGRGSD